MDERFRSKGPWIAAAAVGGIIFLCVTLCLLGALGTMLLRSSTGVVAPVQPPAIEEGAAQPQLTYGPWIGARTGMGVLGHLAFGAVLFFGLLLLLGIGRFVLVPWRRSPNAVGGRWKGHPHPWGPHGWHAHGKAWHEGGEPLGSTGSAEDQDQAGGEDE
jgi:hypothetical protein